MSEPITYLVAHVHEALIADGRLNDQAIEIVVVAPDRLELRGEVATPQRRLAAVALVRQLCEGIDVVDDLCVTAMNASLDPERL